MPSVSIMKLLKQAAYDGVIECPNCGGNLEPDNPKCQCGWKNPLPARGYI